MSEKKKNFHNEVKQIKWIAEMEKIKPPNL